jgi:hypothetical protein
VLVLYFVFLSWLFLSFAAEVSRKGRWVNGSEKRKHQRACVDLPNHTAWNLRLTGAQCFDLLKRTTINEMDGGM